MEKLISNVKHLTWKPFLETDPESSFSGLTSDGKPKYFILKTKEGWRVYGIDGINDGGTEFKVDVDTVKEIVHRHWVETVLSYLKG